MSDTDRTYPIDFVFDGDAMVPTERFKRVAQRQYVVGHTYRMGVQERQSSKSRAHYFASIHEAFMNLPEEIAAQYPTAEHLRKRALIKAGYRHERVIACESKAQAERIVAIAKTMDEFAVVMPSGSSVVIFTPKSQSPRSMDHAEFQKSKDDVLHLISELIGVKKAELEKHGAGS